MNRSKLLTGLLFAIIQMPISANSVTSSRDKTVVINFTSFHVLSSEENNEKGTRQFLIYNFKKNALKAIMSIQSD